MSLSIRQLIRYLNFPLMSESQLNKNQLLERTQCQDILDIRVISLRNKGLSHVMQTLSLCQNLVIAYMQGNKLSMSEFNYLPRFQMLRKLDLSNNQLKSIPPASCLQEMYSLRILHLHSNLIQSYLELNNLIPLPEIFHITLYNNHCSLFEGY